MNVSLTPQLESYIKQKVSSGMYNSVSEVVREGLRLLEEKDKLQAAKLEALRIEINKGLDSIEQHGTSKLDIEAIKQRGRQQLNSENDL